MPAFGAPYQLSPSQRTVSALLSRVSGQRMAAGGTPVNTLTENGPVAAPYTGDINAYGEGPEHDFFPAPTKAAPAAPTNPGGSGGTNSGGSGAAPAGNGYNGTQNAQGYEFTTPGTLPSAAIQEHNKLLNIGRAFEAQGAPLSSLPPGMQSVLKGATGSSAPATQGAAAPVDNVNQLDNSQPQGADNNPLNRYLRGLQSYQQPVAPRQLANGGQATDNAASAEAAVAAPQQNVKAMEQRGEQPAGGPDQNTTGQDMANANVAVNPSLKSAIGIGAMVAGLAGGPALGALGALTKIGSFDVNSPRLTTDALSAASDAYNNTTGPLTDKLNAFNNALSGARASANSAINNQSLPGAPAGYGLVGSNYGNAQISANFASPGFNGPSSGDGGNGGIDASHGIGGGYGNTATAGGVSRGSSFGGSGPDPAEGDGGGGPGSGGGYRRGGGVRNYARGGVMRYPSVRRFADGGSSDDDSDSDQQPQGIPPAVQQAQQQAQANAAYAQPTTAEYIADPAMAYQAMINATRQQAPGQRSFQLVVPKRPIPLQSYDDGGSVDGGPIDPSIGVGDAVPTDQMNGAVGSNWLPLLAGAFQASQGDPASAAASVGVAAAMTGQTPQQAMDSATLLHRSGAANMPKAGQQQAFDPNRASTNQLLAQLAQGAGLADKLALSATNPSQAMGTAARPYEKPQPRMRAPAAAAAVPPNTSDATNFGMLPTDTLVPLGQAGGGEIHEGPGAVSGEGDGQEDKIPALLSDGEFVFDASTVSALGNGSNKAGAARLEKLRQAVRNNAGWKNPKKIQKPIDIGGIIKKMAGGRA